jgi:hypothetical protein
MPTPAPSVPKVDAATPVVTPAASVPKRDLCA